jgi:sodium-dependent dicarboxylate transporter 2/3/5
MGGSAFGIPSAVVSFIPIVVLAISGVMTSSDVRELPWDVLLLLAGGLSLGVGVKETGLAEWLAGRVPTTLPPIGIAFVFAAVGLVLSNLMSNTAAAALLIPLGGSLVGPENARLVIVAVAMGCSAAMCLPISTPPNAIVYSSGRLTVRDFMIPGLLLGALVPFVVFWLKAVV